MTATRPMTLGSLGLAEIEAAHARMRADGAITQILSDAQASGLLLKPEFRLPAGSYKTRGVLAYFASPEGERIRRVSVLSAGNLALATARECARRGIVCEALVPEGLSSLKRAGLVAHGAVIRELPYAEIWRLVEAGGDGTDEFLHPFDHRLLAGYATLGLELAAEASTASAIVVPFGLGGLVWSVIQGLRAAGCATPVYAAEIRGYAPFSRARAAGAPVVAERYRGFIEAMGAPTALPIAFESLRDALAGVVQVSEGDAREELRRLREAGLTVEGAAAVASAAARRLLADGFERAGPVVAVLSGGNLAEVPVSGEGARD